MALNEVAQRHQLSKTSTFRPLRTLESSGYLIAGEWGKYSLAPGVQSVVPTQTVARLLRAAIPPMQQFGLQLRETASLAALFDNRVEAIAAVERAALAFQSEERREKLVRSLPVPGADHHRSDGVGARIRPCAGAEVCFRSGGICFRRPLLRSPHFRPRRVRGCGHRLSLPKEARVGGDDHRNAILAALRLPPAELRPICTANEALYRRAARAARGRISS